jgi:AcrR family transcriptional regulator
VTQAPSDAAVPRVRGEYRKTARRREEIVDAALAVFSRVGYVNSSMSEIAKNVGMTVPGLTHHYPSKADLLAALFDRRDLDANQYVAGRAGLDILRGLVEIAQRDEEDAALTRMYAILAAEATDPAHPAHDYFKRRYAFILGHVEGAFTQVAAAGLLRAGMTPSEAARTYVAFSDGLQLQVLYDSKDVSQAVAVRRLLEGFLTSPL